MSTPTLIGEPPTAQDLAALAKSWLTPELIEAAGIRRLDEATARDVLGRNGSGQYRGLAFPYIVPGVGVVDYRIRRDVPDVDAKGREVAKYLTAPGCRNRLYFPPGVTAEMLADTSLPVVIVEGEKKALALWRLATEGQDKPRYLVVGIAGVWSWRGTRGKQPAPGGGYRPERDAIADLDRIVWTGRQVNVCFDSDVESNEQVRIARRKLADELRDRDALPLLVAVPDGDDGRQGIDDLLAAHGPEKALALFAAATPSGEPDLIRLAQTDVGNAERLEALHGRNLCWIHERKGFGLFDGTRWMPDTAGEAKSLAVDTIRATYRQAGFITSKGEREAIEAHARRSEKRTAIDGMLSLFPAVGTTHSVLDFNTQLYLLNCSNGTLDLETGRLYKPRRADLISRLAPVPYDPTARCPTWKRFLVRIMGARGGVPSAQVRVAGERCLFLQKAVGYSLTADVSEKVVFGLFGPKDSGKTTFLEAIRFMLGDYAGQVLVESLLSKSDQSDANAKEDLADLHGRRFVTTSEAERRHRLAGARLKYLTQGAHTQIKSARKYEHTFTFPATHKLWIDSNERPSLSGTDDALWERFKPVPFAYPVSAEERDPNLPDKLRAEAPGVLAWAVEGFKRWRKEGLGDPPDVVAARQDWRDECDPLKDFLEECCRVDLDAELWTRNTDVWKAYESWAKENGERYPLSRTAFGLQLEKRGLPQEIRRIDGKAARVRLHVEVT